MNKPVNYGKGATVGAPASYGSPSPATAAAPGGGLWPLAEHPAFGVPLAGDLAVIACHFNPAGFRQPVENMRRWLDWLWGLRLPVFMAELSFGDAAPVLPRCDRVAHFRAGPEAMMFQKEPLLNLAERIVPRRFSKVAALDADVILTARRWAETTSALLDASPMLQPFSHCRWLDRGGGTQREKQSAAFAFLGRRDATDVLQYHPGFAWAMRREFFEDPVGGFPECAVIGGGDIATMLGALGFAGRHFYYDGAPEAMVAKQRAWAARCAGWSGRWIGCAAGEATHLWHGSYVDRQYQERYDTARHYNPDTDLSRRHDGLTVWSPFAIEHKPDLVAAVRNYFPSRKEDG